MGLLWVSHGELDLLVVLVVVAPEEGRRGRVEEAYGSDGVTRARGSDGRDAGADDAASSRRAG